MANAVRTARWRTALFSAIICRTLRRALLTFLERPVVNQVKVPSWLFAGWLLALPALVARDCPSGGSASETCSPIPAARARSADGTTVEGAQA